MKFGWSFLFFALGQLILEAAKEWRTALLYLSPAIIYVTVSLIWRSL